MADWRRHGDGFADEIQKIRIDRNMPMHLDWCLRGIWYHTGESQSSWLPRQRRGGVGFREGSIAHENFPAGMETHWCFFYDEIQYCLSGKAELTYTLRQTRYAVEKTIKIVPGDVWLVPNGADCKFKVDPSGDFKKLCFIMPAPQSYMPGSTKPVKMAHWESGW